MDDFYVVVEITRNWDWEREEELVRSRDKNLCERIAQDLTNHIDHVAEARCEYSKSYEVFKESKLVEVKSWGHWLEIRKDYGDIEE